MMGGGPARISLTVVASAAAPPERATDRSPGRTRFRSPFRPGYESAWPRPPSPGHRAVLAEESGGRPVRAERRQAHQDRGSLRGGEVPGVVVAVGVDETGGDG